MSKQGIRIIPKINDPITGVTRLAIERGWHLKKAVPRNPDAGSDGEFVFYVSDRNAWVILRDDLFAGIQFLAIVGAGAERETVAAEVRAEIDHWTEPELFAWWDRAVESGDIDDKVDAVLFLGVNTPEEPDEEYVSRIRAALADEDRDVRNAAVAATAYADWRVFRDALERISASDPDEKARERARFILTGWTREDASG